MKRFFGAAALAFVVVAGCSVIDGLDVGGYDNTSKPADGGVTNTGCLGPNGTNSCAAGQICCAGACIPSTQTCTQTGGSCTTDSQCSAGQVCAASPGCTGTACTKSCTQPYAQLPSNGLANFFLPADGGTWAAPVTMVDGGTLERVIVVDNLAAACQQGQALVPPTANTQYVVFDMFEANGFDGGPSPLVGTYNVMLPDAGPTQRFEAHAYSYFLDGQCTKYTQTRYEATGGTLNLNAYDPQNPASGANANFSISTPQGGTGQQGSFAARGCTTPTGGSCASSTGAITGTGSVSGTPAFTVADATTMPASERSGQKAVVILGAHASQCAAQIMSEQYQSDVDVVLDVWNEDATKGPLAPTATGTYTIINTPTPSGPGLYARALYVANNAGTCNFATGSPNRATGGTVTISSVGAAGNLSGTFSATWTSGTSSTGSFSTGWCGWRGNASGQGGLGGTNCVP